MTDLDIVLSQDEDELVLLRSSRDKCISIALFSEGQPGTWLLIALSSSQFYFREVVGRARYHRIVDLSYMKF